MRLLWRALRMTALVAFVLPGLFFLYATVIPFHTDPIPAGYRDRSVATFFIRPLNRQLEVYFLTHPFVPRTTGGGRIHDLGQDIEFNAAFHHAGIAYTHLDYINNFTNLVEIRGHDFYLPTWMLAVVSFLGAFLVCVPWLRKFHRRGVDPLAKPCPNCRYDLRAHGLGDTGGKCPECGQAIIS